MKSKILLQIRELEDELIDTYRVCGNYEKTIADLREAQLFTHANYYERRLKETLIEADRLKTELYALKERVT